MNDMKLSKRYGTKYRTMHIKLLGTDAGRLEELLSEKGAEIIKK